MPLPLAFPLLFLVSMSCAAVGPRSSSDGAREALYSLFSEEWEQRLDEDPLLATMVGDRRGLERLPSRTLEDAARRADQDRVWLERLARIDRGALDRAARIDHDVFREQIAVRLEGRELGAWQIPFTSDEGFHIDLARLPELHPFEGEADYAAYLSRLADIPRYVDEHLARLRLGLERGMTQPKGVVETLFVSVETHIVDDPIDSIFWKPFADFPAGVPEGARARLEQAGHRAIRDHVVAGYRSLGEFLHDEYLPRTRESIGAYELPDGEAYYRHTIRRYTTLDLSPEEIHETGLAEVARIREGMLAVIEEVGFEGDFAAFLEFLRTDPQFYAKTPGELLREAAYLSKKMDAKLPDFFGHLPGLPYGVAPVPDHLAPTYTGGRYVEPPADGSEPGWYWVNTYALESRPLYVLPALTLHEAVPGHHLQHALSFEQGELQPFRRYTYISAYGEGWGLYSEYLGIEAGMYTTPYEEFGRMTYEMWRACRLVVDTGMHAFGWSRARALEYLARNTALSLHECTTEIDRYISWPGQALSYKLGELEIRALRAEAEEALGPRFDLRGFHDLILSVGSVPLSVLREEVERWIDTR